jgi:hypothetical protein
MSWSLNEIEAEVKKALRGADLAWGLAEEGAKAARWLAARAIDPMPAVLDVLDRHAGGNRISSAITLTEDGHWNAPAPLCPITFGASLCDHAQIIAGGTMADGMIAGPVARPLLVIPFVARAARLLGRNVSLTIDGDTLLISARGEPSGSWPVDRPDAAAFRCVATDDTAMAMPRMIAPDIAIAPEQWARLQAYAGRTYVPANERSRREGAGAGSIDND